MQANSEVQVEAKSSSIDFVHSNKVQIGLEADSGVTGTCFNCEKLASYVWDYLTQESRTQKSYRPLKMMTLNQALSCFLIQSGIIEKLTGSIKLWVGFDET